MGYSISITQRFRKDGRSYNYDLADSWDWIVSHDGFHIENGNASSEHAARQAAEQAAKLDHAKANARVIEYEWEPDEDINF